MKKSKNVIFMILGILLFAAGLIYMKAFGEPQGIPRVLPFLGIGVGSGLFGYALGEILSKKAREKDPAMAKKIEIEQKDERNIMLANASKAKGYDMMTYVFGAVMLAFVLMGAAMEVVLTFVGAYVFIQIYTVVQRVKSDRNQ